MSALPLLSVEEHSLLEQAAGRPLTNDEAQMYRREKVLLAAFIDWLEVRNAIGAAKRTSQEGAK